MTTHSPTPSTGLADLTRETSGENAVHLKAMALRTYSDQKASPVSEDQITDYLPMVNGIARKVASYLRPPLSFEDLVSAGTIGLLKAAKNFDPGQGASFKTYAYIRIKGAILDELRSISPLPSQMSRQVKELAALSQRIIDETGVAPTDEALAQALDIPLEEVYDRMENARALQFTSLHANDPEHLSLGDAVMAKDVERPDDELERHELLGKMTDAIQELDPKRRRIIVLYYTQHLGMRQIADLMDITESRVSQLHASALFNLSAKLRDWRDGQY